MGYSDNKNVMTNKTIRKEFRWRGLPLLFASPVCPRSGIPPGPGGLREEAQSSAGCSQPLPLPTADSITRYLLLSVGLMIMLLHMTRGMSPARDGRGAREKKKNLHKTYFIQDLNVTRDLQLRAQLLPGCEQLHSISADLGR